MVVKFQVERRPINSSGKVYRGGGHGDFITVLTNPENIPSPGSQTPLATNADDNYPVFVPAGAPVPKLNLQSVNEAPTKTHVQELNGEPWLAHSTHFSIDAALTSAAPLAGAIGQDNVRIVKVLNHRTVFQLN